mmetsp:Transcript_13298/g.25026  ORF Transcript_13298/g.25026 Transcript_13298/m.25026 type:complete len:181 (+) Transcript_13298:19-561(+)
MLRLLWWILESQVWVVKEHRNGLKQCAAAGSPTAKLVATWAPIMCFPQWVGGLVLGLRHSPALAIFFARMTAMCVVRKLDETIPCTRALGLCHLVTFGPIFPWILSCSGPGTGSAFDYFLFLEKRVIALCLFLDARDLLLHWLGYPFPCYIREGAQGGKLAIDDARVKRPVDMWARLIGP